MECCINPLNHSGNVCATCSNIHSKPVRIFPAECICAFRVTHGINSDYFKLTFVMKMYIFSEVKCNVVHVIN
jgi:hypothetical protein